MRLPWSLPATFLLVAVTGAAACGGASGDGETLGTSPAAVTWGQFSELTVTSATASSVTLHWLREGWRQDAYRVSVDNGPWIIGSYVTTGEPGYQYTIGGLQPCSIHTFTVEYGTVDQTTGAIIWTGEKATVQGTTASSIAVASAPPLDSNPTDFVASTTWIYSGQGAPQTGISATIDPSRVGVVRGTVRSLDGSPLACVRVQVTQPNNFGAVVTGGDGTFSVAVNAGQPVTLKYAFGDGTNGSPAAFLPVQRNVPTHAHAYTVAQDVRLIPNDAPALSVSGGGDLLVGNAVASESGDGSSRSLLMYVPAGAVAHLDEPTGATINSPSIRQKEYTVGSGGVDAMPGSLPAATAYTFAMDASVVGYEGHHIYWTDAGFVPMPIDVFIENKTASGSYAGAFLGVDAGTVVPLGTYDDVAGSWQATPDAACVFDFDPSNTTATHCGTLPDLDSTAIGLLKKRYTSKARLWRARLTHFSASDWNFAWGVVANAIFPGLGLIGDKTSKPRCTDGSIIECENQTLGEELPLAGTPFSLVYNSARHPGRWHSIRATFQVPTAALASTAKAFVAGRELVNPDQTISGNLVTYEFHWDGKDAFGRPMMGRQAATVRAGLVYQGAYQTSSTSAANPFSLASSEIEGGAKPVSATGDSTRMQATLWTESHTWVDAWDDAAYGLDGWSLSAEHYYDPVSQTLYRGDGSVVYAEADIGQVVTIAGNASGSFEVGGAKATDVALDVNEGVAVGTDGAYYADDTGIWRVNANGTLTAILTNNGLQSIAIGGAGDIYFGTSALNPTGVYRIRRNSSTNTYGAPQLVAGCVGTCNGPLPSATRIDGPASLAFSDDGWLYIGDSSANKIWRLRPDTDQIEWFAGDSGLPAPSVLSDVRGKAARLIGFPSRPIVAVSPGGVLYVADESKVVSIRTADGIGIDGVLGFGMAAPVDGATAQTAQIQGLAGLAAAADGTLYVSYENGVSGGGILRVRGDGTLQNIVYNRGWLDGLGGMGPSRAEAYGLKSIAAGQDGSILFAQNGDHSASPAGGRYVRTIRPSVLGGATIDSNGITVVSPDGREKYVFNTAGVHLRTIDATTGTTRYSFQRDASSPYALHQVLDAAGHAVLSIGSSGSTISLTSYLGSPSTLTTTSSGLTFVDPAQRTSTFTFDAGGLMQSFNDPAGTSGHGSAHYFYYDPYGRFYYDAMPDGGSKYLTWSPVGDSSHNGWEVDVTTAQSRLSKHSVSYAADGSVSRTLTDPAGLSTTSVETADGTQQVTIFPGGPTLTTTMAADPRFGASVLYPSFASLRFASGGASMDTTVTRGFNSTTNVFTESTQYSDGNTRTWTTQWNPASRSVSMTTPTGLGVQSAATTVLDAYDRPIRISRLGASDFAVGYDVQGRIAAVQQGSACPAFANPEAGASCSGAPAAPPAGCRRVRFGYDDAGSAAPYGGLKCLYDPLNRRIDFLRDALGRPTQVTLPTNGSASITNIARSNWGDTTISVPKDLTGTQHNDYSVTRDFGQTGFPASFTPPPIGSTPMKQTVVWSADGDFSSLVRASGGTISAGYDSVGRLSSVTAPAFGSASLGYDPSVGYVNSAQHISSSGGVVDTTSRTVNFSPPAAFLADTRSRSWNVTWNSVNAPFSAAIGRSFDTRLRLSKEGFSVSGVSPAVSFADVSVSRDADGAPIAVGQMALTRRSVSAVPTPDGRYATLTLGGVVENDLYDADFGELADVASVPAIRVTVPGYGTPFFSESIVRDAAGRVATRNEVLNGVATQYVYGYAPEGWLTSIAVTPQGGSTSTTSYPRDRNGNRLQDNSGNACSVDVQDRIVSCGSTSHTYDANGFLNQRGSQTFVYDGFGGLVSYTGATYLRCVGFPPTCTQILDTVQYQYDEEGRRISRAIPAASGMTSSRTMWVYGEGIHPLAQIDTVAGQPDVVTRFVYATHEHVPDYAVRNGVTYRIVTDHLGTVRAVVNMSSSGSAAIMETRTYDAFGVLTSSFAASGWTPLSLGFAGGIEDRFSGLVRFGARDYDPTTGRWTAREPLLFGGGQTNLYQYAAGDPVNVIDTNGHNPVVIGAGLLGGAFNAAGDFAAQKASGGPIDKGELTIAFGFGFIQGVVNAVAPGNAALVGGLLGGLQSAVIDRYKGKCIEGKDVLGGAFFGWAGGKIGGNWAKSNTIPFDETGRFLDQATAQSLNAKASLLANTSIGSFARGLGGGLVSNYPVP